jgi:phage terminase large subunit-like protein
MRHVKYPYAHDPKKQGFYWADSEQKRIDYFGIKRLTPDIAESVYQCRPGARTGSIFVQADFCYYRAPPELELGMHSPHVRKFVEASGGMIGQGWDTALTATPDSNHTVGVTVLMVPCTEYHRGEDPNEVGPCDPHFEIYVLDVYRDKVEIGDLVTNMRRLHRLWNPHIMVVEKKANGAAALQTLTNTNIPLEGVTPSENKRDRAVNGGGGAGSTQGWFRSGRIHFPTYDSKVDNAIFLPWLEKFEIELKDFTGDRGGTDDQVDALVHITNWAIREGSASGLMPTGYQTPEQVDRSMMGHNGGPSMGNDAAYAMGAVEMGVAMEERMFDIGKLLEDGLVINPFDGTCGTCTNFVNPCLCKAHKRVTTAMNPACDRYADQFLMSFPRS